MTHRRREFPSSVKRDAWERCLDPNGIPRCEDCTVRLGSACVHYDERLDGEFDHDQPDALLGDPTLDNCVVRCKTCHLRKSKNDRKIIAKSNHTRDNARGIRSKLFRPLPGGRNDTVKKTMRGEVVLRSTGEAAWSKSRS